MKLPEFKRRLKNILIGCDIAIFAIVTFGNCEPRQTASAAAWDCLINGRWQGRLFVPMIDTVARWLGDFDHCQVSWDNENTCSAVRPHIGVL